MENLSPKKSIVSRIFQFDKIATLIGFTVDCITIISIMFALHLGDDVTNFLPKFISPELALGIWVIASYTYLAFLHQHWDKNRLDKNYKEAFGRFIAKDLIQQFRNPLLLFPFVILLVILVGIIAASDTLLTILGIIVAILFAASPVLIMVLDDMSRDASINKESKAIIENNWDYFKKRLKIEMSQNQWIDIYYLTDVAELFDIEVTAISYAFAKYAFETQAK